MNNLSSFGVQELNVEDLVLIEGGIRIPKWLETYIKEKIVDAAVDAGIEVLKKYPNIPYTPQLG